VLSVQSPLFHTPSQAMANPRTQPGVQKPGAGWHRTDEHRRVLRKAACQEDVPWAWMPSRVAHGSQGRKDAEHYAWGIFSTLARGGLDVQTLKIPATPAPSTLQKRPKCQTPSLLYPQTVQPGQISGSACLGTQMASSQLHPVCQLGPAIARFSESVPERPKQGGSIPKGVLPAQPGVLGGDLRTANSPQWAVRHTAIWG
jgi:hypothetical protein